MRLLKTNLTNQQAELLFYMRCFKHIINFGLLKEVEIIDEEEIIIYGLIFTISGLDYWVCGQFEMTYPGNYENPPEYDFIEINAQNPGESINSFVCNTVIAIIREDYYNYIQNEAESVEEYKIREFLKDEIIPW